ncbi:hypothetical protein M2171_005571 [Bradyrhizobium japonicum USDA 38]|nr:hypothetical protein [Bradyrhizobium japonicum USDA 38]MCS3948953.1 hypothetical protein [Bradyrhizobium japonicum]
MVAHDFSQSVYDCPACKRLGQIKHDFSKSPSECPGCREKAAIKGGYAAHVTNITASAHYASADRMTSVHHQAAEGQPAIDASWDAVITELNIRKQSPPVSTGPSLSSSGM